MTPIGLLGIWGGWVTAETGRQPWIVYGKLLTAQAVSPLKPVRCSSRSSSSSRST
jgi:cytochrome d ubiquinol oxidase subunit I